MPNSGRRASCRGPVAAGRGRRAPASPRCDPPRRSPNRPGGSPRLRHIAQDSGDVRHSVGERDGVVDVVDVPAGDAEMRLDLRRGERERVDDQIASPGREARRRSPAAARRSPPARRPSSSRQCRRAPTGRRAPTVVPSGVLQARVDRGVDVPLDRREVGSLPACTSAYVRSSELSTSVSRGAGGWWRRAGRGPRAGSVNVGRPVSARLTFIVVPSVLPTVELVVVRGRKIRRTDELAQPEGIGCNDDVLRAQCSRHRQGRRPAPRRPMISMLVTAAPVMIGAPALRAARRSSGDRAHAAAHDHPGAVRARQPAHVVDEEVMTRSRACPTCASSPDKPSVTAYIALHQVAAKPKRAR